MVQIIPAVLSTTEEDFVRDISRYQKSSLNEGWVHIDFADNIFVQNGTIRPSLIAKYPTTLHKEAHLMVSNPLQWIDELVGAGFERVVFHIEAQDVTKCIEYIKAKGLEVGLAIKNETSLDKLEPFMDRIDVVLVMGIVPGFQGQKFIPETINKIKETSRLRSKDNYNFRIGVDGSVRDTNIKEIVQAGADFVIIGSFLLKGNIDENLENLWEKLNG